MILLKPAAVIAAVIIIAAPLSVSAKKADSKHESKRSTTKVQLGPRPYFLVNDMQASALKDELQECKKSALLKLIFPLVIAVLPCSFLNTLKNRMKQLLAWVLA